MSLYRKWRPQTFAEVRGQERVVRTLQNELAAGRIGHAYLFCGPRGVGKTTTARLLAKAVNCLHEGAPIPLGGPAPVEPDNSCSICRQIAEGRCLDVIEIDAASNGRIDDARGLREQINFAPNEARYKFYIIDEAHQITKDAFDALLKTFEEPPAYVIFVLATTDPNKVPATILSRCQRFDFRRISVVDLLASLTDICAKEDIQAEPGSLEVIARAADGGSRDSLSLLDQAIAFCGREVTLAGVRAMLGMASSESIDRLAAALLAEDAPAGLEIINQAVDAGVDPRGLNRELVERLRNLLLLKVSAGAASTLDVSSEVLADLRERAAATTASRLIRQVKIFSEADYGFRSAPQPQLPLEIAFLEAIGPAREDHEPMEGVAAVQSRPPSPIRPAADRSAASHALRESRTPGSAAGRGAANDSEAPATSDRKGPPRAAGANGRSPLVSDGAGPQRGNSAANSMDRPSDAEPVRQREEPARKQERATPEAPASVGFSEADATLEGIVERWPRVLEIVRGQAKTVEAVLKSCIPTAIDGATITLSCESPFHAKTIETPDKKRMVEGAISRVAGRPCYVSCVVRGKKAPAAEPSGDSRRPEDDDPLVRAALRMLNARALE